MNVLNTMIWERIPISKYISVNQLEYGMCVMLLWIFISDEKACIV